MKMVLYFIIIGGLGVFGSSQIASAANYFNWGVETDSFSACCDENYGKILGWKNGSSRSSDTAHSGTYSMKLQVHGNDGGNQGMGVDLAYWNNYPWNIVGSRALYYRWWMKIMPGFNWGNDTQKVKASRVIGRNQPEGYTGYMWPDGFNIAECNPTSNGCLDANGQDNGSDSGLKISYDIAGKSDGQWHEYIVMVKPNSAISTMDAEFKVWVDSVLVGQLVGWRLQSVSNNLMAEAWMNWMLQPYFQLGNTGSNGGGTIYVDDFSTDDTYNSLIGGNSNSSPSSNLDNGDITPPTNLEIITPISNEIISGMTMVSGICSDETSIRGMQFKYGSTNIGTEDISSPGSMRFPVVAIKM